MRIPPTAIGAAIDQFSTSCTTAKTPSANIHSEHRSLEIRRTVAGDKSLTPTRRQSSAGRGLKCNWIFRLSTASFLLTPMFCSQTRFSNFLKFLWLMSHGRGDDRPPHGNHLIASDGAAICLNDGSRAPAAKRGVRFNCLSATMGLISAGYNIAARGEFALSCCWQDLSDAN